jgi:hypothetical protein
MDINYLIGMLIIIAFCLLGYTHIEHLSNEVIYIKSNLDNNEYLVRNLDDKEEAANINAIFNIVDIIYNNVLETTENSKDTMYQHEIP